MSGARNRPRSQSDVARDVPFETPRSPGQAHLGDEERVRDFASPRRAATSMEPPVRTSTNLRRRSNATRPPSIAPRQTILSRVPGPTLAGPDDSEQLRTAHEAFVHPGYAELNPSYDQPNNARPVWSLAKPLPRVIRPGMVPTKDEILEASVRPELPAEQSNRLGLDMNPNDLEAGKIKRSANPAKVAAQVSDARRQREKNFLNALQEGTLGRRTTAGSRISSQISRRGRTATWTPGLDLEAWEEGDNEAEGDGGASDGSQQRPPVAVDDGHQPRPSNSGEGAQGHLPPVAEQPEPQSSSEGKGNGDADSLTTVGPGEYAYPEDLQPLLDAHIEEEVHNNHTAWSVFRTHYREPLAELTGVMIQLTIGFCCTVSVTAAKPAYQDTTDWAFGLATMIAIYVSGGISGAHLNPSITMMFWFYRGFPKRKMPAYFAAQFLGAFLATFIVYAVNLPTITHYEATTATDTGIVDAFITSQRFSYITPVTAFFNEFVGTTCLVVTILALGDDQNAPPGAGMNAFVVGLVIVVISIAFGHQTGAALNPSRDFGPRLALLALGYGNKLFTNPYWFYGPWAASLTGAFFGAFIYDSMIFTGGESPVNYPWSRTKRSFLKGKKKWARRLHLENKDLEGEQKVG